MIELYIMRHGQTMWNAQRKIQGSTNIDLLDEGRDMAVVTGKTWEEAGIKFDAVYSSPLNRAYETAKLVSAYTGLEVTVDQRLRELNFGVLEGEIYLHLYDVEYDPAHGSFFTRPELYQTPENGESLEEICQRGKEVLEDILKKHKDGERVLIVAHGAMNKAILKNIKDHEIKDFWAGNLQKNCGATIVDVDKDDYTNYRMIEESVTFY